MDMYRLVENKVAIVTGGTRGIGNAVVRKLLEHGAKVALLGSRQETADKAVAELEGEYKGLVIGLAPDLCDQQQVSEAFEKVREHFGTLDILANNAGLSSRTNIYEYTLEEFEKIMRLNVTAPFVCSQAAARIMKEEGGGVIINTSSMVAINGQPSGVAYPTSKAAVDGMTRSLARELAKDKIRVNAVAPGVTMTTMLTQLPEELRNKVVATIPLGRIGQPVDIANAFLYLASDLASYVTGTVLHVDGAALT